MNIAGFTKTSLVDYPGELCTTIFISGCNMRCPFCHNGDLVLPNQIREIISINEMLSFLNSRQNIIESICITGGEPTLQVDLIPFIRTLKDSGFKIKLDTNGLRPDVLNQLILNHLVDYIAMDIKNSTLAYGITVGNPLFDISNIKKTVQMLQNSTINHEFRTTITKEFHTISALLEIGDWLQGAKKYVLQKYQFSPNQLTTQVFTAYSYTETLEISKKLSFYFDSVEIRGF